MDFYINLYTSDKFFKQDLIMQFSEKLHRSDDLLKNISTIPVFDTQSDNYRFSIKSKNNPSRCLLNKEKLYIMILRYYLFPKNSNY